MEGFQVPVFKGDDKPPVIVPTDVEHCFVGIEPIGKYADGQTGKVLFDFRGKPGKRFLFAVLFLIIAPRLVFDKFRGQQYGKAPVTISDIEYPARFRLSSSSLKRLKSSGKRFVITLLMR